jgi:hypothetical protein
MQAEDPNEQSRGYASALDLPSVAELLTQIKGLKMITLFVGRKQRAQIKEVERLVREITSTVDQFYEMLGDRNWIFHDDLYVEKVTALVSSTADADVAEATFIEEQYRNAEWLSFMIGRLRGLPAMRLRIDLIRKAEADYREDRFYAVVLVLIAVMDGFVNDLDRGHRQGLHAREASDLAAWDSVVGHHKGLAHAHAAFTKSFKGTQTEPVYELYRNGIVHGNLTNFDNLTVATKAWNRLFAVADWARAREKQQKPTEPKPTLREVLGQVAENGRMKKLLDAWEPSRLTPGDPGFAEHSAYAAASAFFEAWQLKRYGLMVPFLPYPVQQSYGGAAPRQIRDLYQDRPLTSWRIEALDFVTCSVCETTAMLIVDAVESPAHMRWLYGQVEGSEPVIFPDPGVWRLTQWGPEAFLKAGSSNVDLG